MKTIQNGKTWYATKQKTNGHVYEASLLRPMSQQMWSILSLNFQLNERFSAARASVFHCSLSSPSSSVDLKFIIPGNRIDAVSVTTRRIVTKCFPLLFFHWTEYYWLLWTDRHHRLPNENKVWLFSRTIRKTAVADYYSTQWLFNACVRKTKSDLRIIDANFEWADRLINWLWKNRKTRLSLNESVNVNIQKKFVEPCEMGKPYKCVAYFEFVLIRQRLVY